MTEALGTRDFIVRAGHVDRHHARVVPEHSFEAAAIAYLEDSAHAQPEEDGDLRIIVRDLASGHEHCFSIDRETGEAAACD